MIATVCDQMLAVCAKLADSAEALVARFDSVCGVEAYDDDAPFVESDHPRGPDGKFLGYKSGAAFKEPLASAGFKKQTGQNKLTYTTPTGDKLVFEPPKGGAKQSAEWSFYPKNGSPLKGKFSSALQAALAKAQAAGKAGQATNPAQTPASPPATAAAAPATAAAAAAPATAAAAPKPFVGAYDETFMAALGGKKIGSGTFENGSPGQIYEVNNSKAIISKDGEWYVSTSGFTTKHGNGMEALGQLLGGGGFTGSPPWSNAPNISVTDKGIEGKAAIQKTQKSELFAVAEKLKAAAPSFTKVEKSAVVAYSGSQYSEINKALRHGGKEPETAKHIASWLDKASLPEPMKVYRRVSGEYSKIIKSIIFEGAIFQDKGFVSTSYASGVWSGDLTMIIDAPKGAKGAIIEHVSHHKGEKEILFQRNSKFKVNKISGNEIHCEIIT